MESSSHRLSGTSTHSAIGASPYPKVSRSPPSERALRPPRKTCGGSQCVSVEQFAVEHDDACVAQIADTLRRIAFDEHQVSRLANLDGTRFLFLADELRRSERRCGQCFGWRKSRFYIDLEFTHELDTRAVGARHDGNPGFVHLAEQRHHLCPARSIVRAREIFRHREATGAEATLRSRRQRAYKW